VGFGYSARETAVEADIPGGLRKRPDGTVQIVTLAQAESVAAIRARAEREPLG
jgi:acylphosphatase